MTTRSASSPTLAIAQRTASRRKSNAPVSPGTMAFLHYDAGLSLDAQGCCSSAQPVDRRIWTRLAHGALDVGLVGAEVRVGRELDGPGRDADRRAACLRASVSAELWRVGTVAPPGSGLAWRRGSYSLALGLARQCVGREASGRSVGTGGGHGGSVSTGAAGPSVAVTGRE